MRDPLAPAGPPPHGPPQEWILDRAAEFRAVWPVVEAEVVQRGGPSPDDARELLWRLWLPLADRVARAVVAGSPRVQGIQGPVGSGKSTLAAMLALLLNGRGLRVARVSLDDLYHPAGAGVERGPPGSHDVQGGIRLLDAVRRGDEQVELPRYDKGARQGRGDRVAPEVTATPDILLFEGWFVGCLPRELGDAPSGAAAVGNRALEGYRPLWQRMDTLWGLRAPSEAAIRGWRHQAEEGARRRGDALEAAEVDRLLDRMLGALPPGLHGALHGDDGAPMQTLPPPELLLDLDEERRPLRAWAGLPVRTLPGSRSPG